MTASAARSLRPSSRWSRRPLVVAAIGAAVLGIMSGLAGVAAASPTPSTSGEFVPTAAARLVNSAAGKGWKGKLQPGATKTVTASGVAGVPDTNVLAVMLHITTSGGSRAGANRNGNVWTWPAGATRPPYAMVANAPVGATADNTAIIDLGDAGQISFFNGAQGSAVNVVADVVGYVTQAGTIAAGATFAPLTPTRIVDTSLTSGAPSTFQPLGMGHVPTTNVAAVALNLGAEATGGGNCWVQVQPSGTPASDASYPRVQAYTTYASQQLAVVAPDAANGLTLSTNCTSADVFADVEGYYLASADGSQGSVYVPVDNPTRVIDTRQNLGIKGQLIAGRVVSGRSAVPVTGVGGVPATATAVALNVGTINGTATGSNTIWTDGTQQPIGISTVNVDPLVSESNLAFIGTGANGKVDVAATSSNTHEMNDLFADIEGYFYHSGSTASNFGTPQYFPEMNGDTYYNTVGASGDTIMTSNDTRGVNHDCVFPGFAGSDIGIFDVSGEDPGNLQVHTVNCMHSFGKLADRNEADGCTWKSGGITQIHGSLYLAVARQTAACNADQTNGLQPSFNSTIMRSDDDGLTWKNPWSRNPAADGESPPWSAKLKRFDAMFPGQTFSAPFFIQYGPGNTGTVDKGSKYLYAVSNDGYAYNGNYLKLARVPLGEIQNAKAWQFYVGAVGGYGQHWSSSPTGATHILDAPDHLSQPAIQWVPALHKYVMTTFYFAEGRNTFRTVNGNPYTRFEIFTSPKPWGPWTKAYEHSSQRNLWCTADPCQLISQPGSSTIDVGAPDDWTGYYDPSLVQKFAYSQPLSNQMLFVNGDWMNKTRFPGENLYTLHGMPFDLSALPAP